MTEYEQIIKRAQEQGINLDDKYVLIPGSNENRFRLNGSGCFGRVFEDIEMAVLLRDVDFKLANSCLSSFDSFGGL